MAYIDNNFALKYYKFSTESIFILKKKKFKIDWLE